MKKKTQTEEQTVNQWTKYEKKQKKNKKNINGKESRGGGKLRK